MLLIFIFINSYFKKLNALFNLGKKTFFEGLTIFALWLFDLEKISAI